MFGIPYAYLYLIQRCWTTHTYSLIDAIFFFIAAFLADIFCYLFSRQQTRSFQRLL